MGHEPDYTIDCELANPNIHERGALSIAHAEGNTEGSQFLIVHDRKSTAHLDGNHTIFGKVVSGVDYIDEIKQNTVMKEVKV